MARTFSMAAGILGWMTPDSAICTCADRHARRRPVLFCARHLTDLQGWNFVADLLLHHVMPALLVIDWLLLVFKQALKLTDMIF